VNDALLEAFVNTGPEMIEYVEKHTKLRFVWSGQPDYHPEHPGSLKAGRSLGQPTFNLNELGDFKDLLRKAPLCFLPMGWNEIEENACLLFPATMDFELIARRMEEGLVGMGMSLIGHLFKAALDRDIRPILRVRANELIVEDGAIIGLRAIKEENDFFIRAHKGIILASGGFEWNEEMKARFLSGSMRLPCSSPHNEGDGLKMAMALGARLRNMHGCIGTPVSIIPGEEYDGRQLHRMALGERSLPHTVMVNRYGKRFVNESHNYSDISKAFNNFDPVNYDYTNVPAWCVFDQQFKDKYAVLTNMPDESAPSWLEQAESLEALANKTGIEFEGLNSTIERFNEFAVKGIDYDFKRGESLYDQLVAGDPDHKPNPCLGTIDKPPFYALRVYPGTVGTCGGLVIDATGQVVNANGEAIEGLYAAGNVMASIAAGPGYSAGGGNIGPGMTWGYICGRHAAKR
jgi:succinate dehydrogenase/fumarate reductase flavoprotein subunit